MLVYAGVWRIQDGRLLKRLAGTERSRAVVSHTDVTRDGRYVITVESRHGHVVTPGDHVIIYDVISEQRLFDETSTWNVNQLMTTADSDKVDADRHVITSSSSCPLVSGALGPNTFVLHAARSCDSRIASYSVSSVHSVMLSVHLCHTPSTEPSNTIFTSRSSGM